MDTKDSAKSDAEREAERLEEWARVLAKTYGEGVKTKPGATTQEQSGYSVKA
jgi:hypothetical protein